MSADSSIHPPALPPQRISAGWVIAICIFIAVCTVGAIPAFYTGEKIRGRAAWRAYEAEARQRGVKLEFAHYIPQPIPDADNFASIPIFEAVFHASDNGQEIPDPFKFSNPTNGKRLSDPIKQKRTNLIAWQKFFVESKVLPVPRDNAATDVLEALDRFNVPLAQLRDAGTRSHCRFPVHWEKASGAALPHLTVLQSASKIYALRLASHLELGESAAAYEDFRDGLRLTTAILDEPSLTAGLVRMANAVTMENAVWSGLASRQWAEPALRKIEADLAALDWLKDYVFAMNSERGEMNLMTDLLIAHPEQLTGVTSAGGVIQLYPTGWFYQSKVRANRFVDEMLARIDLGERRYFGERAVPSSPTKISSVPWSFYYLLFALMVPEVENIEKRYVHVATMTDQTRLGCALERWRMNHGTFPAAIAELAPEILPVVPAEIVNGAPYHYRRTDDGAFVLYSVGIDLVDDGGLIDPEKTASKQTDWVWRYP